MVAKEAVLKCCTNFWRILFIILNSIFGLIGLGLVGLGIYLLASQNNLEFITGNQHASGGALILISGLVTAIIALVGLIGAAGMWPAVLIIYIIIMLFVIILEIVAGVLGFVYRNELESFVEDQALIAIEMYEANVTNDVTSVVDFMQQNFMCCGYTSFQDWLGTPYFNATSMFPDSCNCTNVNTTMNTMSGCITVDEIPNQLIYSRNCSGSVADFVAANLIVIGAVGITFAVIELIGLAISIGLCICFCVIKRDKDDFDFDKAI